MVTPSENMKTVTDNNLQSDTDGASGLLSITDKDNSDAPVHDVTFVEERRPQGTRSVSSITSVP